MSVTVTKREFFVFIKPAVKVSGQHCWYIQLSQQLLDAVKCIVDGSVVFGKDSAPV